ncbi:MAG TPA: NAD(P)H-binding protein, partial [Thermoanaerobaculia bacterium]|nr:NAD(P)H-binding protein [Thermoanaerobaculia bacterium]
PSSVDRLGKGAEAILGDALDARTFADRVAPSDTFVHLVGVAHPSPAKGAAFKSIDLVSIRESVAAATASGVRHFVYLSVAMPAPAMRAYVSVREEGERLVRASGIAATFVRPWYVLGPGHYWPYAILPLYWFWSLFDRDTSARLYPVKLERVVQALADAVEHRPDSERIIEAPEMRGLTASAAATPTHPAATSAPAHRRP